MFRLSPDDERGEKREEGILDKKKEKKKVEFEKSSITQIKKTGEKVTKNTEKKGNN